MLLVGGIAALTALGWLYTLDLAADMAAMRAAMPDMPMRPWGVPELAGTFVMWAVMMVAMMLPSATPAILMYARMRHPRTARLRRVTLFVGGYLAAWTLFSAGATLLQWGLHEAALLSQAMAVDSRWALGGTLLAAGLYQLSPWKYACLRHCQSPLGFFFGHWRDGALGSLRMGIDHGLYCVGCCWLLMLLLFVVGIMNLLWVAGLAVYVLLEKLVPGERVFAGLTGAALTGGGLVVLLVPLLD